MTLVNSPWTVTFILVGYLVFVLKLGKSFMEHRNPYNLKNVMLVYNVGQVIFNFALFVYVRIGSDLLI